MSICQEDADEEEEEEEEEETAAYPVLARTKKDGGLSGGAIAGIIIACAAVLIGSVVGVIMCKGASSAGQPGAHAMTTNSMQSLQVAAKPVYY